MEPFKELINIDLFRKLAVMLKNTKDSFEHDKFVQDAEAKLPKLELRERMYLARDLCARYLPGSYHEQVSIMLSIASDFRKESDGFVGAFMPDFVAKYGLDDFDFSMEALRQLTVYSSSEFGIRPFILKNQDRAFSYLYKWCEDENHHVRRLASEGSRPKLPWGIKLQPLINDPSPVKPILENLKADDSLYVRKSVANHLNDISKDNSDWMLELVTSWDRSVEHTAWIIKRACRTLLKAGDPRAFPLFGFEENPQYTITNIVAEPSDIVLGDTIEFSFVLTSSYDFPQKLMVDYCIHYLKKRGNYSSKVFKLKEIELGARESLTLRKKQQFVDLTIRKHNPGIHYFQIQVNGERSEKIPFRIAVE
jgi:3-methyladenine DNA glycosylase AlkC